MRSVRSLLDGNRRWASRMRERDPEYFSRLAERQRPEFLWIGCSDSRVPANQIIDLDPGEVFVHRNVANVVVHSDFNCLSVIQFAVEVLRVSHIIVCGHYGCGGVKAAGDDRHVGLSDNWLRHVRDVRQRYEAELMKLTNEAERIDRLCEANVVEQVRNVCHTTVVQEAWARGQSISVHGWIYAIQDGLLRDLDVTTASQDEIAPAYRLVADAKDPTKSH